MGMKCINCGADNNLQDRTDNAGRCKQCNHPFAFEPSTEINQKLKFTDKFFEKAINDLSVTGSLYFTLKQFHYFLDRRLKINYFLLMPIPIIWLIISVISVFLSVFLSVAFNNLLIFLLVYFFLLGLFIIIYLTNIVSDIPIKNRLNYIKGLRVLLIILLIISVELKILYISSSWLFILSSFIGISGLYLLQRLRKRQVNIQQKFVLTESKFEEIIRRWESINSPINKMLPIPSQTHTPANISSDITNYSFDRAVICDRHSIAQMLIANNFHFEHSCAVLSVTGYPESIFETVMTMLKRNPNLKVYVLHDASPKGVGLANYLRTNEQWFTDSNIAIYDVGLFPRQVFASQESMFIINGAGDKSAINQLPDAVKKSLSAEELAWLALGNIVELESFTPQKIMQVLSRAMNSSITANSQSSLFSTDHLADAYFYSETFG